MTLQVFKRGAAIPPAPTGATGAPAMLTALTIDAADEAAAFIIRAPKAGNIRSVWYRAAVTTGATVRIGIYDVDTSVGNPHTPPTPFDTNSFVDKAVTTGENNDFVNSGDFTADAVVAKGDLLAVCFIQPASSPGSMIIHALNASQGNPYQALFTGTWAKSSSRPLLLLEYSDGSVEIPYGCCAMGDAAASAVPGVLALSTSTTPDVAGARFKFPGPVRVNGCWIWIDPDGDFDLKLVTADWDGASSGLLASLALASGPNVRSANGVQIFYCEFDTAVELTADTYYRLLIVPTSTTGMNTQYFPVVDADAMGAQPLGVDFHWTTAKDPNDNTDFTNYDNGTDGYRVPWMGLVIDAIDDGAGGAGGLVGSPLVNPLVD